MTSFINFDETKVVGIRIDGKISDEEFDEVTTRLKEKLSKYGSVRFYAEMDHFEGAGLEGLFRELKLRMKNLSKFEKDAVVTDKKWMKEAAKIADKLFPSMEVKSFSYDNRQKAREWVKA